MYLDFLEDMSFRDVENSGLKDSEDVFCAEKVTIALVLEIRSLANPRTERTVVDKYIYILCSFKCLDMFKPFHWSQM